MHEKRWAITQYILLRRKERREASGFHSMLRRDGRGLRAAVPRFVEDLTSASLAHLKSPPQPDNEERGELAAINPCIIIQIAAQLLFALRVPLLTKIVSGFNVPCSVNKAARSSCRQCEVFAIPSEPGAT